jgi:RNA polymerase sigma-70 factor (ECF subfamily)
MSPSSSHTPSTYQEASDAELLELFQKEHEADYLGILFQRYRHLAFGVAYKYFRDKDDAEDMVSHVFSLLLDKLPGKEIHSFKQYLYGTVRNECLARTRQLKKESERQQAWAHTENSDPSFMEIEDMVHLTNDKPLEEVVQEAIDQLGEEQRICVLHFFFEGKSYKEIAIQTGYTLKSVKSYLQNGKRNLKKLLEEYIRRSASG